MAKKRYSEIQIYRILHEDESGIPISTLVKKYKISQATIYNWRAKHGSNYKSEKDKISKLEEENKKLKALFVELSLENLNLKAILRENLIISELVATS